MICRDTADLVSRELDARLAVGERIGLGVHTLFCGPCRRFRRQPSRLDAACRRAAGGGVPPGDVVLSATARARIAAAIDAPPSPPEAP